MTSKACIATTSDRNVSSSLYSAAALIFQRQFYRWAPSIICIFTIKLFWINGVPKKERQISSGACWVGHCTVHSAERVPKTSAVQCLSLHAGVVRVTGRQREPLVTSARDVTATFTMGRNATTIYDFQRIQCHYIEHTSPVLSLLTDLWMYTVSAGIHTNR